MKIGELDMHCGNCEIIEFCDEPFSEIRICKEKRFKDIEEDRFLELAETSQRKSKKAIINDVYKKIKAIGRNNNENL